MQPDAPAIKPVEVDHDDRHLPRPLRRFPYLALNEAESKEVRREADAILRIVEDMVHSTILKKMTGSERNRRDLIEDIAQTVQMHLFRYALARFDQSRNTKVTTFLFRCIQWKVTEEVARHRRRERRRTKSIKPDAAFAPDTLHDRAVEALATRIINDPTAAGLTEVQARVVKAVIDAAPGTQRRHVAASLGYVKAASLSFVLRRAIDQIKAMDVIAPAKSATE